MAEMIVDATTEVQDQMAADQLSDRLVEFGWVVTRPFDSVDNSLLVHIHFQGQATGVSFPILLEI
jgi:hypothetical protein